MHANLYSAQIYQDVLGNWAPISSTSGQTEQVVYGSISSFGIYAVLADWEAKIFLPMVIKNSLGKNSLFENNMEEKQTLEDVHQFLASPTNLAGIESSQDDKGYTTITDIDGNYNFSGLPAGPYTLTASQEGYDFVPISRTITLPPDAPNQNFTRTTINPGEMVLVPAGEFQMGCNPLHNGGYSCYSRRTPLAYRLPGCLPD